MAKTICDTTNHKIKVAEPLKKCPIRMVRIGYKERVVKFGTRFFDWSSYRWVLDLPRISVHYKIVERKA